MSTALIERDPPAAPAADEAPDSIDTWLAVLMRLLHVSSSQREAIRDEIETHLRERVRDLMIGGAAEHDAIRTAISELGEVADLARRFSHASKLRIRRTIMNIAVLGVGAVSIATATIMFNGQQQPPSRLAVFESQPAGTEGRAPAVLDDKTVPAAFAGHELGLVLQYLAEAAGVDLVIDHRALDAVGVSLEEKITLNLRNPRPVAQVLDLVAAGLEHPFAWRAADGMLEVSTGDVFDRREIVLASFDVQNVLDLIWATSGDDESATERLESLIIEYVEPSAWQVNGGDLANVSVVGGKMFVKSPSRFHEPIQWILSQLEESAAAAAARPPGAASAFWRRGVPDGGASGRGGYSSSSLFSGGAAPAPSSGAYSGGRSNAGWTPLGDPTRPPSAFDPRTAPGGFFSTGGGGAATPAPPAVEPGAEPGSSLLPGRSPASDPLSKPATDSPGKPASKPAADPANPAGGGGSGGK